jgi:hypothetical protein
MDFIDKWTYKLFGRKVPVFRVRDVGQNGEIKSISLLKWVDRPNSLIESWNVIGAEKSGAGVGLLQFTDEAGLTQPAFVEYKGRTVSLYTEEITTPNLEKVIGSGAMLDDIAESMDLGKSMKNMVIGILIGIMIGWLFVAPIVNGMAK